MKILVTGSTGFLGKHFIKFIKSKFENVEIFESNTKVNNLLDYSSLYSELKDINFDYIFHFAAHTKAGDWCLSNAGEQWIINQQINTNIIRFWKEVSPNALFVGIGTSCSYGDDWRKNEDFYLAYEPEESLYTYAYTKRMLYLGLDALKKQYGMTYCYFVPSTLYGTDFTENDNHFIYDVIRKIAYAKENSTDIEMWGDGIAKRELTWVIDFIKIMTDIVFDKPDKHNRIINIASGKQRTILDYYKKICLLFDYDERRIVPNLNKYVGMKENKLIVSDEYVKMFDFISLDTGLNQLINYFVNFNKYEKRDTTI